MGLGRYSKADEARKEKRGLWADPNPIAPWDWRKNHGATEVRQRVQPNGIEIVALLPNPEGRDEGHEQITIANSTGQDMSLDGWMARDKAGNEFALTGTVPAVGRLVVTMTEPSMPLNNDGDEVELVDGDGVVRSRVNYTEGEVRVGELVEFGK